MHPHWACVLIAGEIKKITPSEYCCRSVSRAGVGQHHPRHDVPPRPRCVQRHQAQGGGARISRQKVCAGQGVRRQVCARRGGRHYADGPAPSGPALAGELGRLAAGRRPDRAGCTPFVLLVTHPVLRGGEGSIVRWVVISPVCGYVVQASCPAARRFAVNPHCSQQRLTIMRRGGRLQNTDGENIASLADWSCVPSCTRSPSSPRAWQRPPP